MVDADGEVFGEAPNVGQRVQAAAEPGSVLITGSVQRQVAGLFVVEEKGAHELKGVAQPLSLYRVVRASGGGRRGGARTLTPVRRPRGGTGTLLSRRWERARAGEGQLVLVVGEPGLGKSRLIEEFRSQLAETPHTWVEWSASQLLQNTPLHPIAEWGRLRFGADAPAEQRLADLEGTYASSASTQPLTSDSARTDRGHPAAAWPRHEFPARRAAATATGGNDRLGAGGARSQPVVLVFEDLHWADPTSSTSTRPPTCCAQAPLLVLATTRPEFCRARSLRSHHSSISLLRSIGLASRAWSANFGRHALSKELIEGSGAHGRRAAVRRGGDAPAC